MTAARCVIAFTACLGITTATPAFPWREISEEGSGTKVQARFEGTEAGRFLFRRMSDLKIFPVPPDLLTAGDRKTYADLAATMNAEREKLNAAAGSNLFNGTPLDSRDGEELAEILELRPESVSSYTRSWRRYVSGKGEYRLFGARPFSVALYADQSGKVGSLSVVFANKGDYGSTRGSGEDHFKGGTDTGGKSLESAMKEDDKTITAGISSALGPPVTQRFGEGKTRRTIKRWDWNGYSLLLSHEDEEYVSLLVTPTSFADSGGKTARMNDSTLRQRLRASVVRKDNGDVFISDIPMVDQGPKGYCVPATFERAMRTMGIDADMYLLAMVGESQAGGGTSVGKLMENVRRQVYGKGRRTKDENVKKLRIRDVKRYLDDGVPVMWTMMALEEYGKIARGNTSERENATPTEWAARVKAQNEEFSKKEKGESNHHMCMIIGYNETTEELAVTDSWGPDHALKWVPLGVADWASNHGLFLILP